MAKEDNQTFKINGREYRLVYDFGEQDEVAPECNNCDLQSECNMLDSLICQEVVGEDGARHKRFELVPEEEQPAADEPALTEQRAYDGYQERSATAGDRGNMLAWAFICMAFAQLIGSKYFREPFVLASGGIAYLLLSTMQAWWQAVTMWIVKCRIKKIGQPLADYPQWLGLGAWVFYWLKMLVITATSIYGIVRFVKLL